MELDETYFPFSRKGTKGLGDQARTRGGQFKNASLRSKNLVPVLVGRARGQAFTVDPVLKRMNTDGVAAALSRNSGWDRRFVLTNLTMTKPPASRMTGSCRGLGDIIPPRLRTLVSADETHPLIFSCRPLGEPRPRQPPPG